MLFENYQVYIRCDPFLVGARGWVVKSRRPVGTRISGVAVVMGGKDGKERSDVLLVATEGMRNWSSNMEVLYFG